MYNMPVCCNHAGILFYLNKEVNMRAKLRLIMIILLIAVVFVFAFTGCSDDKEDNPVSPTGDDDPVDDPPDDDPPAPTYSVTGTIGNGGPGTITISDAFSGWEVASPGYTTFITSDSFPNPPSWNMGFTASNTGTYTNFPMASIMYYPNTNVTYWTGPGDCTIIVTKYGAVNDTIEGTFSGTMQVSSNGMGGPWSGSYSLTGGTFKVKRIQ